MAELLTTPDIASGAMYTERPQQQRARPISPYLTTAQAASYLGYATRRGLLKAIERGEIAAAGRRGRTLLFVAAELDAMVRARAHAARLRQEAARHEEARKAGPMGLARSLAIESDDMDREGAAPRSQDGQAAQSRRLITNATRSEAVAVLERLRREAEQPNPAAPSLPAAPSMAVNSHAQTTSKTAQPTLGDFIESWLERKIARGDLEETTATRYATDLGHLSKRLLRMRLDEIQPNDIELWMVAARKEGFAPSTINTWLAILRSALNDAPGLLSNPATRVDPLKKPVNLEEPNSLKPEQLRKLLEALREEDRVVCAAAWTQAVTGLRWCEVSALKWEDLDRQERILVIRRKAVKGKLKPSTKTRRLRELGVPELIIEALAALRAWLSATEHPGRESGLMFPSRVGTPLASSRISDALRGARKRAAITQRFTSHGLRRSMTDMLRRAKVDPVIAKAIVGHQTDAMREHYSTLASDEARQAADAVSAMLFGSSTTGRNAVPANSDAN